MSSGTDTGRDNSIPKVREWDLTEKNIPKIWEQERREINIHKIQKWVWDGVEKFIPKIQERKQEVIIPGNGWEQEREWKDNFSTEKCRSNGKRCQVFLT